jgi:hypothetical protein
MYKKRRKYGAEVWLEKTENIFNATFTKVRDTTLAIASDR